jgi:hypothetical protein
MSNFRRLADEYMDHMAAWGQTPGPYIFVGDMKPMKVTLYIRRYRWIYGVTFVGHIFVVLFVG